MSINRVNISGNLTRDPELRATQGGTSILAFGMAVNDRRRNPQSGEWEDYPNFVDVVVFGNRCDFLSKQLHKGKKVHVEGKLRYSSWEKDGQKRSKLEVVMDEIDFELPPKSQQPPQGYPPQQQGYPPQQYATGGYVQQPAIAQPQGYQQPPQGYAQPAPAPQAPAYPQQPQYAPQQPPQQPTAPQPPQQMQMAPQAPAYPQQPQYAPQQPPQQPTAPQPPQQMQMAPQAPAMDVYDEDIPF